MSDVPTPPYSRRQSEQISADRLTDFRLKQLEEAVKLCSDNSTKVIDALNEMGARLAVGTERFGNVNKRIESLEGDRRWTVMAIIGAFASLVWQAIQSLLHVGPRLLIACALPLLAGCWPWGSVRGEGGTGNGHTVGDTLADIGYWFTWGGGLVMGVAALALVASFFPATAVILSVVRPYIAEAIAIGFAAVLVGSSLLWLGAHPWLLGVIIGLVVVGLCWRYRARLSRIFRISETKVNNG